MTKTIYPDMTNTFGALVGTTCISKFKVIGIDKTCVNASPTDYLYLCTLKGIETSFYIPVRAVKRLPTGKEIAIIDGYDSL